MKNTATKSSASKKRSLRIRWRPLLPWLIIVGVVAAIAVGAWIYVAVTEDEGGAAHRFTYNLQDGSYTDEKQGITYYPVPFYYESVLNRGEVYAESDEGQSLYQIGYRDEDGNVHLKKGSAWLSTAKSVGGLVYYNPDEVRIPELSEFDWDQIYFSNPGSEQFSTYTMTGEACDKLMREFLAEDAENLYETHFNDQTVDAKLTLRVSSNTYTWLYLNLTVYADEEGNYYVTQQGAQLAEEPLMVQVDAAHFEDYFKTLEEFINGADG